MEMYINMSLNGNVHQYEFASHEFNLVHYSFSLGAVADLLLAVTSKKIKDDIMVVRHKHANVLLRWLQILSPLGVWRHVV